MNSQHVWCQFAHIVGNLFFFFCFTEAAQNTISAPYVCVNASTSGRIRKDSGRNSVVDRGLSKVLKVTTFEVFSALMNKISF